MAFFALIPGAGGMAWNWQSVVPLLEKAGHDAVAIDLPGDDEQAGLQAYADIVVRNIGQRRDAIVVAQSLGGFTAPLVCARTPVRALVFVNAMIPEPNETAGAWWDNTGAIAARERAAVEGGYTKKVDLETYFFHDVPKEALSSGALKSREESAIAFNEPCGFTRWPDVPIYVFAGRDDRFFPIDFQRRVARERLGVEVDEIPGGHLVGLSNPEGVAKRLVAIAVG